MRLLRLLRILWVAQRFGLDEFVLGHERVRPLAWLVRATLFWRRLDRPRGERLRQALEALGPIFVKFGQMLSTRRDLIPADIADELARLQDRVPPFPSVEAEAVLRRAYGREASEVFAEFDATPVASASVAQVHRARLKSGEACAVKILRPGIRRVIDHDLELLMAGAALVETLWSDGKRLKPREVVREFAKHLDDELDLIREAANCSQLRRNFASSPLLAVPEVYWDYCTPEVMVMQWMEGIPISRVQELQRRGVDLKRLARAGVEIFFTQVFRDGFFHADMHPGNMLIDPKTGDIVALDFGIMGRLELADRRNLAEVLLGFLERDYARVADVFFRAGFLPPDQDRAAFTQACRALGEPILGLPLNEISFGRLLGQLLATAEEFEMETQPQLLLLQKTMVVAEGVGRALNPSVNIWTLARPLVEQWMRENLGPEAQLREAVAEGVSTLRRLPGALGRLERLLEAGPPRVTPAAGERARDRLAMLLALLMGLVLGLALG